MKQAKVVYIQDDYKISLNIGSDDGVKEGQRYLVYELSNEEIIDPDTKKSLGFLELVKGTGTVIHVQDKMCTIESDKYDYQNTKRTIVKSNPFLGAFSTPTEQIESEKVKKPFENIDTGDLAKRIK